MSNSKSILITGADGYLGRRTALRLLKETKKPLLLWVRSDNEEELEAKESQLNEAFKDFKNRFEIVSGNLRDADPFREVPCENIAAIIHAAAVIRFNVDEATAREVNLLGTRKVLDFAKTCKNLERLVYISTVYASGLQDGVLKEIPFETKKGFANFYEQSKWQAEQELLTTYKDLPWQLVRVSTAIADNDNGEVSQYNAVHNTLKLFYYGLLSLIPGLKEIRLYFVTGDFCALAIHKILENGGIHKIFHLCHSHDENTTLGEMIESCFLHFQKDPDFLHRRILRPIFVSEDNFDKMAKAIQGMSGQIMSQALGTITPFAKQLFVKKDFDNSNLRQALGDDYRAPQFSLLLEKMSQDLVKTKWGRNPRNKE